MRFLTLGNRTTDQCDPVHGPSVVRGLVPAIIALRAPRWTDLRYFRHADLTQAPSELG
jgi:hypothetical protein